jgi:hypothetical protein
MEKKVFYIRCEAVTADGRECIVEGKDIAACEAKARKQFKTVSEIQLEPTHRTDECPRGSEKLKVFYTWDEYDRRCNERQAKFCAKVAA